MTEGQRELARARRVAKRVGLSVRMVRVPVPENRPNWWPPKARYYENHYEVIESLTGDVIYPFLITPGDVTDVCEQIARHAPRH